MKPERIRTLLEPYISPLPDNIEHKVQKYMTLLEKWAGRVSLTSIRDPEEIVRFHFGESIFALHVSQINNGRLADVGSGAGFPGLAIKLARPKLSTTLIEPNKKKSAFLHEVARTLDLSDVQILPTDFESSGIDRDSLAAVACRALGQHALLLNWSHARLAREGSVLLWVSSDDAKAISAKSEWNWHTPLLIPNTRGRFLLRGTKKMS